MQQIRGDHLSGKPGNVREFSAVRELLGKTCLGKLFIDNFMFGASAV